MQTEPNAKQQYRAIADRARTSFNELFWNEEAGCLFDVVNGAMRDASIAVIRDILNTPDVASRVQNWIEVLKNGR